MSADGGPRAAADDPSVQSVAVKLLVPGARLPERAYDGDAAYDLFAVGEHVLAPLARAVVGTGVALGLPDGMCALTVPRSGLAAQHGISIVNAPGLVDPGYRGEVRIILLNTDAHEEFVVHDGDRIAQLLFAAVVPVRLQAVEGLAPSHRGERGFGSSGGFGVSGRRDRRAAD
jgi:dUTP pyrophosphatase